MSIGHYPCDCAQLNVTCGHANCMSGTHVKHDNIPVKIDGVEVGRANVRVFDDHIEVDVLEMASPLQDLLGGFGPVSVAPKGGDA